MPTYYLPEKDVVDGALVDEEADGGQRIWTVQVGGKRAERAAWTHPDPIPENPKIRDLVAFFQERVDIVVDGVRPARPATPWSTRGVAGGDAAHR